MRNLHAVLCFLLLVLVCGSAKAYSETLKVPGQGSTSRIENLNEGDQVMGRIILVGDSVNFSVSGPDSETILNYTVTGLAEFSFSAIKAGRYVFLFENFSSGDDKSVALNYSIQNYIFGLPQEYFLLLVIVGIVLVAVVVFASLSPKP